MKTRRLFIAIPVTADVSRVTTDLTDLGRSIRAVDASHLHLTLRFLGDTEEARIPQIEDAVRRTAPSQPPFRLTLQGLGAFPRAARPTVIWAGIVPPEPCLRLERELTRRLTTLGFEPETRAYRPHLTLARVKGRAPHGLPEFIDAHSETILAAISVTEISLIESTLTPSGPLYSVLASAPLGS